MSWMFMPAPTLLAPEDALPGRSEPVLAQPQPHTVLGTPIAGPWKDGQRVLYVAIGCFWGAEKMYWEMEGVESTSVGYAGGVTVNPSYFEVCRGVTNHTETVAVVYDPQRVSLRELVVAALEAHDPTQGFRQGNDVGTQYRSAFYTVGSDAASAAEEAADIRELVDAYGVKLADAGFGAITTEVMPLADTASHSYFLAEDEHQQYLDKNPNGYCPHHSTGIACG